MTLSTFFEHDVEPVHPKIRLWTELIADGGVQCFISRTKEVIGYQRATIHLKAVDGVVLDSERWDAELDRFLLKNKIRATNIGNEKIRIALTLKDSLKKAETHFGDGIFNRVLLRIVSEAFQTEEIHQRVKKIGGPGLRSGKDIDECATMITASFSYCARNLLALGYTQAIAEQLLQEAAGYYLDERFSLLDRKIWGYD